MQYAALLILLLPLIFVSSVQANTETNVQVNTTTNSTNVSTTNNYTKVRIESNGKVTTYESDKPEDIDLQSEDGTAKVSIKNGNSITITPTGTISATEKDKEEIHDKLAKEEVEKKLEQAKEEQKSIFEKIKDFFNKFFAF